MASVFGLRGLLCLTIALVVFVWAISTASAASFKPVILDPAYDHTRYAPMCGDQDVLRHFRAYTTCFDGADDDDGDGVPDKWAVPHWVAYQIKKYPGQLGKGPKRPLRWITDVELHVQGIAPSDASYRFSRKYRKANPNSPQFGYDRGHMAMKQHAWRLGPNADWNTHTVLNACPQRAELNQGIWLDLKKKTAEWADKYGAVWIITGPVFSNRRPTTWLGEPGEVLVGIPDGFFKILVREVDGRPNVLAFVYPQRGHRKHKGSYDHRPFLVSVDTVEDLTGLDFFPQLDAIVESDMEKQIPVSIWN